MGNMGKELFVLIIPTLLFVLSLPPIILTGGPVVEIKGREGVDNYRLDILLKKMATIGPRKESGSSKSKDLSRMVENVSRLVELMSTRGEILGILANHPNPLPRFQNFLQLSRFTRWTLLAETEALGDSLRQYDRLASRQQEKTDSGLTGDPETKSQIAASLKALARIMLTLQKEPTEFASAEEAQAAHVQYLNSNPTARAELERQKEIQREFDRQREKVDKSHPESIEL